MALAFLRRYQRDVMLKALLAVIIVGFVLVYIPPFLQGNTAGHGDEVGRVGDLGISATEFQRNYVRQRSQYERMYRGKVDANMLKSMGLPEQVFDNLVDQRIVQIETARRGLTVTSQDLVRAVNAMPELQENGHFVGAERVRRMLESQGQSIEDFEQALRNDLLRKQLEGLVTDGVAVSPTEVEREYRRRNEQIKAEYVLVDATPFRAQATASDDEILAHFNAHKESYRMPEKRVVDYVLISPDAVKSLVTATEAEVQGYYRAHGDEFRDAEEVCARHILLRTKSESNPQGHAPEEAQAQARALVEQLRKTPTDFAAVAKKSSEDTGSASTGGDLGCFPRGTMVGPFETAAFALEPGKISDPVKTEYGYHIIQVQQHKEEQQKSLEAVREKIKTDLASSKGQALVEAKSTAMAEALAGGKKLSEAARASGLEVKTSAPIAKGDAGALFDAAAVTRIFELKLNQTEPQPLGAGKGAVAFVSLREITPPRIPELTEVRDKVRADVIEEKALALAHARAVELKTKATSSSLEAAASAFGLTRKETPGLVHHDQPMGDLPAGAALDETAFSIAPSTVSDPVPVTGGYAILRVTEKKSVDPAAFEKEKASVAAALRDNRRSQLFQAYLKSARERIVVEKRTDMLRRLVG
jgi:peptidyl-prolyl cis-trans isomerase D